MLGTRFPLRSKGDTHEEAELSHYTTLPLPATQLQTASYRIDAALQEAGGCGATYQAQALQRVRTFRDGPHTTKDDPQAHAEVQYGWASSYGPEEIAKAVDSLDHKPLGYRINILVARLCFRGIYFPQMGWLAWVRVIAQNRRTIFKVVREAFVAWRGALSRNPESPRSYVEAIAPTTKR